MSQLDIGTRSSGDDDAPRHPAVGERLLAAPALAGLAFLTALDDLGGHLQDHFRTSRARPRNRIPPIAILLGAIAILLLIGCVIVTLGNDSGGNAWMYGAG